MLLSEVNSNILQSFIFKQLFSGTKFKIVLNKASDNGFIALC